MTLCNILLLIWILGHSFCSSRSIVELSGGTKWNIIHHVYHGPPAPLSENVLVIDTPMVAKARFNHLAICAPTAADLAKKMMGWPNSKDSIIVHKDQKIKKAIPCMVNLVNEDSLWPHPEGPKSVYIAQELKKTTSNMVNLVNEDSLWPHPLKIVHATDESNTTSKPKESLKTVAKPANEDSEWPNPEGQIIVHASEAYRRFLPLIGQDGCVLKTLKVRKAKEAHLLAYQQAVKLAEVNNGGADKGVEWYKLRNRIHLPIPPMNLSYS